MLDVSIRVVVLFPSLSLFISFYDLVVRKVIYVTVHN